MSYRDIYSIVTRDMWDGKVEVRYTGTKAQCSLKYAKFTGPFVETMVVPESKVDTVVKIMSGRRSFEDCIGSRETIITRRHNFVRRAAYNR